MLNKWLNKELTSIAPGVYYSMLIASWITACNRIGNNVNFQSNFKGWLKSIGLDDQQIKEVVTLAMFGTMELENSAYYYIERENAKHGIYNSIEAEIKYMH